MALWGTGCDKGSSPEAQAAGERAEEAQHERSEAAGEGPVDKAVAGKVAKERARLAVEVGETDAALERMEGRSADTAANDLNSPDSGAYRAPQ